MGALIFANRVIVTHHVENIELLKHIKPKKSQNPYRTSTSDILGRNLSKVNFGGGWWSFVFGRNYTGYCLVFHFHVHAVPSGLVHYLKFFLLVWPYRKHNETILLLWNHRNHSPFAFCICDMS